MTRSASTHFEIMGTIRKQQRQRRSTGAKDEGTQVTVASSGYDSFLNSCCCGDDSADSWNSFLLGPSAERNSKSNPGRSKRQEDVGHVPLAERLSDAILGLVGAAPPVKFIKCMECANDELSEMTTPRVLHQMAEEYDQNNRCELNSMWSMSSDEGDEGECDETAATNRLFSFKMMRSSACSVMSKLSRKKKGPRSTGSAVGSRADMTNDPITRERSINEPKQDSPVEMTPPRRQAKAMKNTTPKKNARPKKDNAKPKKNHPMQMAYPPTSNEKNKPRRIRRRAVPMKPPAAHLSGASMSANTTRSIAVNDPLFEC